MASVTFIDCHFSYNAKDLSPYVKSVTLNYSAEMLDDTAMGDTTRINKGGLKNWSVDVEFNQDFAATPAPDIDLFSLVGTTAALIIRPVKGTAIGATNPEFRGTGILESYSPINGEVGSLATTPISIQSAGTLTRNES
jgi:hypothetical protein